MIDANRQLPAFYDQVKKHSLSQGKILLYIALLSESCRAGAESFEATLSDLAKITGLKKDTISKYRRDLEVMEIVYYCGENVYKLIPLYPEDSIPYDNGDRHVDNQITKIANKPDIEKVYPESIIKDSQPYSNDDSKQDEVHDNTDNLIKNAMSIFGI